MIKLQTVKFGSPVEVDGIVYTTLDARVERYKVVEMFYESGIITIKLVDKEAFFVFPTNVAYMRPFPKKKEVPQKLVASLAVRESVGK
jgi:hypothetical protein